MKVGADALSDRVLALGRAHNFIGPAGRATVQGGGMSSLHGLLDQLLAPYRGQADGRIVITGEDIRVDDRSATPFALLFHELATNAAKYGALSQQDGRVTVHTHLDADFACMDWTEEGGPAVTPPTQSGFGTKLIDLSIVRQMGGTIEHEWLPGGLVMRVTIPMTSLIR